MIDTSLTDYKLGVQKLKVFSIVALLLFFVYGEMFHLIKDENVKLIYSDVTAVLINLATTAVLFHAAKKTSRLSKTLWKSWAIFALAQLIYTLGDITWAVLELGLSISPYPSISDIFYSLYYPVFFVGILCLPAYYNKYERWYKHAIDLLIVMLAATLLFWNYLLEPILYTNSNTPLLTQVLSVAYPVGDLMMIGALFSLLLRRVEHTDGMGIVYISFSILVMIVTDIAFSLQSLTGNYIRGDLLDIGWSLSYILMAMAGYWQYSVAIYHKSPYLSMLKKSFEYINNLNMYLPSFWLLASFGLLLHSFYHPFPMSSEMITIGLIVIVILALLRQATDHAETQRLFQIVDTALERTQEQAVNLEYEISERKRIEDQLSYDASHDGLTGLPNRAILLDRLEHAIQKSKQFPEYHFSVMYIDIDNFSFINESLGPFLGDQLLVSIGQRLMEHLDVDGTLVRLGGDQFAILQENWPEENVLSLVREILSECKNPFHIGGQNIPITASIGLVFDRKIYDTAFDVLRDAHVALSQAKLTEGAQFVVFYPDLRSRAIERFVLENDLRKALENHEFILYYQPIVSLLDERIVGFEALIRWQNPVRGWVMPDKFIPLAEEIGLIDEIGWWVLNEACCQLVKWQKTNFIDDSLSIHVNISGKQLKQPDFVSRLDRLIQGTGIYPNCLDLEITESAFAGDPEYSHIYLDLHKLGIRLEIDDFGTGYSSLSYLQRLPVDTIKIDRSFISEITASEKAIDLVRAIVNIANSMQTKIIAEGIETNDQLAILRELKCDFGQGFLFSRPVDSQKAHELINHQNNSALKKSKNIYVRV